MPTSQEQDGINSDNGMGDDKMPQPKGFDVQTLIKETMKGIVEHIPTMINNHLESRGVLSATAQDE